MQLQLRGQSTSRSYVDMCMNTQVRPSTRVEAENMHENLTTHIPPPLEWTCLLACMHFGLIIGLYAGYGYVGFVCLSFIRKLSRQATDCSCHVFW